MCVFAFLKCLSYIFRYSIPSLLTTWLRWIQERWWSVGPWEPCGHKNCREVRAPVHVFNTQEREREMHRAKETEPKRERATEKQLGGRGVLENNDCGSPLSRAASNLPSVMLIYTLFLWCHSLKARQVNSASCPPLAHPAWSANSAILALWERNAAKSQRWLVGARGFWHGRYEIHW